MLLELGMLKPSICARRCSECQAVFGRGPEPSTRCGQVTKCPRVRFGSLAITTLVMAREFQSPLFTTLIGGVVPPRSVDPDHER
jgi:hypothetical protein